MTQEVQIYADTTRSDDLLDHFLSGLKTVNKVRGVLNSDEIILNLKDLRWALPTYLGPISCKINEIVNSGIDVRIIPPDHSDTRKYLEVVNFPKGGEIGGHKAQTYLPLCRIGESDQTKSVDDSIDRIRNLLKLHLNNPPGIVLDTVFYPIAETIDNICEHSRCSEGSLIAQYYSEKNFVDICVSDNGISIPGNFERHDIHFEKDEEAIKKAMDGFSTKSEERGFGLKSITNMVVDGLSGKIIITSRGGGAIHKRRIGIVPLNSFNWSGTIVSVRLKVPDKDFPFYEYME